MSSQRYLLFLVIQYQDRSKQFEGLSAHYRTKKAGQIEARPLFVVGI